MNGSMQSDIGAIMLGAVTLAGGVSLISLALAVRGLRSVVLTSFAGFAFLWGAGLLAGAHSFQAASGIRPAFWHYIQSASGYILPVPLAGYLFGRFGRGPKKVYLWTLRAAVFAALVGIASDIVQSAPASAFPPGWSFGTAWNLVLFVLACPMAYVAFRRSFAGARERIYREQEMESARQLNFVLTPQEIGTSQNLRIAQRYVPAPVPRGNFFDIVPVGDARICILIGDVAASGFGAAAIASILKTIFISRVAAVADPAGILNLMTRVLSERTDKKSASASCVIIDSLAGVMACANAGHSPLLVWRKKARKIDEFGGSAVMLGPVPDEKYSTSHVAMKTGDRVILYSKGATEALDRRGRLFGEKRFRDLIRANERLSADQFAEAVTQDIITWTGMNAGGVLNDDFTIIVVDMLTKETQSFLMNK